MPQRCKRSLMAALSAVVVVGGGISQTAEAGYGQVVAQVNRTMVDRAHFGGCMAQLSVDLESVLPDCTGEWVSFSCTGDFGDEARNQWMFDQAQLALAAGKQVEVYFSSYEKHNGYCVAYRIDLIR